MKVKDTNFQSAPCQLNQLGQRANFTALTSDKKKSEELINIIDSSFNNSARTNFTEFGSSVNAPNRIPSLDIAANSHLPLICSQNEPIN